MVPPLVLCSLSVSLISWLLGFLDRVSHFPLFSVSYNIFAVSFCMVGSLIAFNSIKRAKVSSVVVFRIAVSESSYLSCLFLVCSVFSLAACACSWISSVPSRLSDGSDGFFSSLSLSP